MHQGGGLAFLISINSLGTAYGYANTEYYDTTIKAPYLGNYEFKVETHEVPSHEVLPIVSDKCFPSTVARFITKVDNHNPSATYSSRKISKADIVFAFGDMESFKTVEEYVPTFESNINNPINGIDASVQQVETSSISSSDFDIDTILNNWDKIGADVWYSSNGELTCNLPGDWGDSGKNWMQTAIINPDAYDARDINAEMTVSRGGILMEGFGWRIQHNTKLDTYSGYFINFGVHPWTKSWDWDGDWSTPNTEGISGVNLMRFDNMYFDSPFQSGGPMGIIHCNGTGPSRPDGLTVTQAFTGKRAGMGYGSITFLDSYPTTLMGKISIQMKGSHIVVKLNDKVIMEADDQKYRNGTFGFWGNNCEQSAAMLVKNISIETSNKKSLGDAVSDVEWRDNSTKFIIYGEDIVPDYMLDTSSMDYQYTVQKLLTQDIYLIVLGKDENKDVFNQLINNISPSAEQRGKFLLNIDAIDAMNGASDTIISLLKYVDKDTRWVLVNTPMVWETDYDDVEHDLPLNFGDNIFDKELADNWGITLSQLFTGDKTLAEKWRFRHIYNYYDNGTKLADFNELWIQNPVEVFTEPGLYRINYKRKDNPFYTNTDIDYAFNQYRYWSTDYDQ